MGTAVKDTQAVIPAPSQALSPDVLISTAIQNGAGIETLEKLMALQERHEANEARKAYHKAMAAFKANPPVIHKDATVTYNNTSYDHATLANVTDTINKALSEHGLSAGWRTEQNGSITVICTITHELGHSESTSLSAPADKSGSKNAIQAIGSTITYLQRYTLLALTGLAAGGQDDDGQMSGTGEPGPYEKWDIALTESTENGNPDDVVEFWKMNGEQIKKDCGKVKAAKIHSRSLTLKKELEAMNQ